MAIQQVTKFQTSDGKMWDDKSQAKSHENELHAAAELRRLLASSVSTGRVEAILGEILVEAPMVMAILKGFVKRQPKQSIEVSPVLRAA